MIRLSGSDAFAIADRAWKGGSLCDAKTHTAHLGVITAADGSALDQAVATVFRGPNSFTGEDTVEFSVHGSKWIQRNVVERLVELGAEPAAPGEFTQRAYMNRRMDLAQAEAVADLIASSSRAAHRLALNQMRGGFSRQLESLRENLVDLASLLELELDFSEEEVEFADRSRLLEITETTLGLIERLASTYRAGRAFKEGVPVAIAGRPNAGKSTLLNRLLGEDKAIVSDIPGTTRDVIEDTREIGGILFRFYDTAGLRDTSDTIEKIGIDRAHNAIDHAAIVLWLVSPSDISDNPDTFEELSAEIAARPEARHIILLTKSDLAADTPLDEYKEKLMAGLINNRNKTEREDRTNAIGERNENEESETADRANNETDRKEEASIDCKKHSGIQIITISAKTGEGIDRLESLLVAAAKTEHDPDAELIITNARHHAELQNGAVALRRVRDALQEGSQLPPDLIAQDVREALHHLGLLTGAVTTDTLLTTIFSRFCIGK